MSLELQGGEVRIVFGGSQWYAETDVHDANERIAARQADHSRADESVSSAEGFDHGCFMEFSSEEKNQEVQATTARCAGWNVANAAARHRSRPGIS